MNPGEAKSTDRARLAGIARQAMIERGLEPDFPPAAQQPLATIRGPADATNDARDMRDRLWASIDNDDSRDRDQLTVASCQVLDHSGGVRGKPSDPEEPATPPPSRQLPHFRFS